MMNISKIVVIGAGVMGSGIAEQLANADFKVHLLDIIPFPTSPAFAENLKPHAQLSSLTEAVNLPTLSSSLTRAVKLEIGDLMSVYSQDPRSPLRSARDDVREDARPARDDVREDVRIAGDDGKGDAQFSKNNVRVDARFDEFEKKLSDIAPQDASDRNILAKLAIAKISKNLSKAAELIMPGNLQDDIDLIKSADWIIEAIVEKIEFKRDLYQKLESLCKPNTIISSNTSTICLEQLIEGRSDKFKQNFLITHFFNPPRYMQLVEIISSDFTKKEVIKNISNFIDINLGKTPIKSNDTPGFIANRIGCYWLQVALKTAIEMEIAIEDADFLMSSPIGIPKTGVFGLYDLIGIDVMQLIIESLNKNLDQQDDFVRSNIKLPLIDKMIQNGLIGRKGKGGFYRITKDAQGNKIKEVIDLKTGEYRAINPVLITYKNILEVLDNSEYGKKVLSKVLSYALSLITEAAATSSLTEAVNFSTLASSLTRAVKLEIGDLMSVSSQDPRSPLRSARDDEEWVDPARDDVREDVRIARDDVREDVRIARDDVRVDAQFARDDVRVDAQFARDDVKEDVRIARDDVKEDVQIARDGDLAVHSSKRCGVSDSLFDIDQAMKLGFNWKFGPFELVDKIGADYFIELLKQQNIKIPPILSALKGRKFYQENQYFNGVNYTSIEKQEGILALEGMLIYQNDSASIIDIGDNIAAIEITSKMGVLNHDVFYVILEFFAKFAKNFKGLVIANNQTNFSVGGNLKFMLEKSNLGEFDSLKEYLKLGQQAMLKIKYSPIPVVASMKGMAFGGGCEILLHAQAVVVHAEATIGLVEAKAGLVPGWGGCKEMIIRSKTKDSRIMAFKNIILGNVFHSADGFQKIFQFKNFQKVMNPNRVLYQAKQLALKLAQNYQDPEESYPSLLTSSLTKAIRTEIGDLVQNISRDPRSAFACGKLARDDMGEDVRPAGDDAGVDARDDVREEVRPAGGDVREGVLRITRDDVRVDTHLVRDDESCQFLLLNKHSARHPWQAAKQRDRGSQEYSQDPRSPAPSALSSGMTIGYKASVLPSGGMAVEYEASVLSLGMTREMVSGINLAMRFDINWQEVIEELNLFGYDKEIAEKLAEIFSSQNLDEDNLLKKEQEIFITLLCDKSTLEQIKQVL